MEYSADELGNIFNRDGHLIKEQTSKGGYKHFSYYNEEGWRKETYSHRFIWEYFNGKIPKGLQIDHINHNKQDNRIENLRIVSPAVNSRRRPSNKLNCKACRGIKLLYKTGLFSMRDIAEDFDCASTTIWNCINNNTWTC